MEARERFIEITDVTFLKDYIEISWVAHIGFGILTIHKTEEGFEVETECLGEEFYKDIIDKFKEYLLKDFKIVE
jgi:hypothetical protein